MSDATYSSTRPAVRALSPRLLAAAVAAALSATLAAAPAGARQAAITKDDAPPTDGKNAKEATVQQVQVHGALDAYDPRRDDTASKIVVNHDDIVKYGDTSVLDVLKRVPGVTVSGSGGRGGEVRMRGLGAGYTQILINGERAPAGFSIDSLAPDLIERIEVLRAASAEFSTQSIAGTINIVLKKTVKAGLRELKAGYVHGSGMRGPNANLQLSDKAGGLSYSVAANYVYQQLSRESHNVEQIADAAGQPEGLRLSRLPESGHMTNFSLTPRLNWTFAGGDTLTSQTFLHVSRYVDDQRTMTDTELGPPPLYPALEQATNQDLSLMREELNWNHRFASGARLDAKLSGSYFDNDSAIRQTGGGNPAFAALHELIRSGGNGRTLNSMGKFTSASWEGHALAFGWDGGYSNGNDGRHDRDYDQPEAALPGGETSYISSVSRLAVYSQDEWNVTPRWSVYLGVRWEGIQTETEGNTFAAVHNRSTVLSPLMQTLYKLPGTKGDQLRLALTRTYKAPSIGSLIPSRIPSANNSQTDPDTIGNPDLKPELALGVDAAWEHYWAEGALLSVSASARNIDNNTRDQVSFDGSRWVSRPQNTGHARARGLELEAKFPLKAVIATATQLDLRASLSRNWSAVDTIPGPNNRLMGQTPLSATLGADYRRGALTAGGSFVFKNGGPLSVSANQATYESVRRGLDLYTQWKFDQRTQLRLAVANLLAQDWISESSYTIPGQGAQRSRTVYPGTASLRATLETRF